MPKVQTKLADKLKAQGLAPKSERTTSLWDGPEANTAMGGISQSMLSRYAVCPFRFSVKVIDGLSPIDKFSRAMEFGNMWHVCEEAFANSANPIVSNPNGTPWERALEKYLTELCNQYRNDQEDILHWANVCRTQFPTYIRYWSRHRDVQARTPLLQEYTFNVPYRLPSGRTVYLRGKWDSVDLVGKGKNARVWLMENKTKSKIDSQLLLRQLTFDLQCMFYYTALNERLWAEENDNHLLGNDYGTCVGVRYNVIRHPLAGGKHSITQWQPTKGTKCTKCKGTGKIMIDGLPNPDRCPKCNGACRVDAKPGETKEAFYNRLSGLIEGAHGEAEGLPGDEHFFFKRWNVEISKEDMERFKVQFLNPCLENLCDDYEWWNYCKKGAIDRFDYTVRATMFPNHQLRTFRVPYGVWNVLAEGGVSEVDEFIQTGSTIGLTYDTQLFRELN